MKLTDEQVKKLEEEFCNGCAVYNGNVQVSNEAYVLVQKLITDRQAWKEEAKTLSDQLNQAMEVLEWIKDAGTDYQSSNKAASFLSSLSQETEVNHETGWAIGKIHEKA